MLLLVWLLLAPRTPDLAAAVYRVDLFGHAGFSIYDARWYAGHELPGYSVLFAPLGWLLGARVLAALSVLVSVACFEGLTAPAYGRPARSASVAFAVAAIGDVWIGRLAFALGVSFALAAALALARRRPAAAGALAALSAAASPVAGLLLALAALTHALWRRSPPALLALAAPAVLVALALSGLFAEGGWEPYPIVSFAATALVVAAFAWALPAGAGELRLGAALYALACGAALLVHTPMGSNVERYGVLLAGPMLLCALAAARGAGGGEASAGRGARFAGAFGRGGGLRPGGALAALVALVAWGVWTAWGPLRETLAVAGEASTRSAYYAPVERFVEAAERAGTPVRIEVPLTRSHWEAAELAPRVSLARGWEKQLDERYDGVLLSRGLTAAGYERWLHEQAVAYVALPDAKLDASSAREGALVAAGLPYLREVFASRHWRIYAVRNATPIATGPGRLSSLGHESFALSASARGSFVVRVHYTRYWTLARGEGCVGRAPGGWTRVVARAPGELRVRAVFSLARALGGAGACRAG